jgi:hypothetical protein
MRIEKGFPIRDGCRQVRYANDGTPVTFYIKETYGVKFDAFPLKTEKGRQTNLTAFLLWLAGRNCNSHR